MPKASDPIVIPAIAGIDGKFTCLGTGLLYENNSRETPENLKNLLLPSGATEPITDRSRSKVWWAAQLLFYELPYSKTDNITAMRGQLESALRKKTLALPDRVKQLENKSNREFKKLNKEVFLKTTGSASSPIKPYTKPTKSKGAALRDLPPPRKESTSKSKAPQPPGDKIGATPKTKTVSSMAEPSGANPEGSTKRTALKPAAPTKANKPKTIKKPQDLSRTPSASMGTISIKMEDWTTPAPTDVAAGYFEVACPQINPYDPFSLNIVRTHGQQHLEADFDFGVAFGTIHSKRPIEGRNGGGAYVAFEWCGKEPCPGDVLVPSSERTGYIKFDWSQGRPVLKGGIASLPGFGPEALSFTGQWRSVGERNAHRWSDFDEEAYRENQSQFGVLL